MKQIHPELAGTKKALALGTYVKKKKNGFPLEEVFKSIDDLKLAITASRQRLGKEEDDGNSLIAVVADMFDRDEELLAYVLEKNFPLDSDNAWRKVCRALAWTVIQEYDNAVKAEKWPIQ